MEEKKKRVRKYDPEKYNPEVQARANKKYREKNVKPVMFNVNRSTEPDILDKLDTVKNRSGYIKELIRKDTTLYRSGKY